LDKDGTLLQANKTLLDYMGFTLEEMKGAGTLGGISRDVHPEDLDRFEKERSAGLSKGGPSRWRSGCSEKMGSIAGLSSAANRCSMTTERWSVGLGRQRTSKIESRAENRVRNENVALREEIELSSMFEEIVGSSGSLRRVLGQVSKVAPTDSTVLISGETGTGKELTARARKR
jgi:formate hydrogenlyase transcriptional activator